VAGEVHVRAARRARIRAAQAALEARAAGAAAGAAAQQPVPNDQRGQMQAPAGPGSVVPAAAVPAAAVPAPKDQYNFTDPDSRIMPSSQGFVQAYNAQAAVDS